MRQIPPFEGRDPDEVRFTFTGSVDMEDGGRNWGLATLGTQHSAYAVVHLESASHKYKEDKDGNMILDIALRILDLAEDPTGDAAKPLLEPGSQFDEPADSGISEPAEEELL